ncbi:hypothetical protein CEXT_135781 [Caerostris extrusa]|uniref:Uncharacterized protein n=1 Tax=Caerostris extrusa TaxID=172846 RepID=A0AAV4PZ86_CAEEX|nr:hypothetical protein CEXT_135781 [Caerostris extrusa]
MMKVGGGGCTVGRSVDSEIASRVVFVSISGQCLSILITHESKYIRGEKKYHLIMERLRGLQAPLLPKKIIRNKIVVWKKKKMKKVGGGGAPWGEVWTQKLAVGWSFVSISGQCL